jgi:hypothetical protein
MRGGKRKYKDFIEEIPSDKRYWVVNGIDILSDIRMKFYQKAIISVWNSENS